jgi:hypothetical protein
MTKARNDERPADITFWFGDGQCSPYRARVKADTELSIGRTDSKRALGFVIRQDDDAMDFVLNKDQCTELAAYLSLYAPGLREPLGRKQEQHSPCDMLRMLAEENMNKTRQRIVQPYARLDKQAKKS